VAATPNFDFSLEFLGQKEKDLIKQVIEGLRHIPEPERIGLAKKFRVWIYEWTLVNKFKFITLVIISSISKIRLYRPY